MAVITKTIGTGVGSAGTGNVDTDGSTAVTSGSVATAFTTELTAPGTIEIAGTLFNIASITNDDNLVTVETVPSGTNQSYNIGSRDYSTVTAWEADSYDSTGSDNAIGEMYNDSDFNEDVVINDTTPIDILLTVPVAERHDGTANTGVRFLQVSQNSSRIRLDAASTLTTVSYIEMDNNDERRDLSTIQVLQNDHIIEGMLIHSISAASQSTTVIFSDFKSAIVQNSIIYDIITTTGVSRGINCKGDSGTGSLIQNNTIFNVKATSDGDGSGFIRTATTTLKNDISVGCDVDYGDSGGTEDFNMASDDTDVGANSIGADDGVVTGDQFVSTTGGSEDLHLKSGSDAINAGDEIGTTPAGINIDIDGTDRTTANDWDMGAHEFIAAAGGRIMGALAGHGGLAGIGGIAGLRGGIAG